MPNNIYMREEGFVHQFLFSSSFNRQNHQLLQQKVIENYFNLHINTSQRFIQ
jgi:hypothetical protein